MSGKRARTERKALRDLEGLVGTKVVVPEKRARQKRARTGAVPLEPTREQLRAARERGWRFSYFWPGKGRSADPERRERKPDGRDHWAKAPIGVFERTVKLADAAMVTVDAASLATPATGRLGKDPCPSDASQELQGVSAGEQANQGVVSTSQLGEPNRRKTTTSACSRSSTSSVPAPPALPPLPVLAKGDASTAIARLGGGFGIEALDALRGREYAGLHVEVGDDTEYVERAGARRMLSYQFVVLDRDDAGEFVLHEWVLVSRDGGRIARDDALSLVISGLSRRYRYADYQGWWVHLPADGPDEAKHADEEGNVLKFVPAPPAKPLREPDGYGSCLARAGALAELCRCLPYEEEARELLAWAPVDEDSPRWLLSKAFDSAWFVHREGGRRYALRGLLRADSFYADDLDPDALSDEQLAALREGRRYRDFFEGTRASGCSVGYTANYAGIGVDPNDADGAKFPDWKLDVTLVSHYGMADLTGFDSAGYEKDLLVRTSKVQGGLVTLRPMSALVSCATAGYEFQDVLMSVRDTMCYAPPGKKSLAALGEAIDFPKIDVPQTYKEQMDLLLRDDIALYLDYAVNDAVVCLLYAKALFGVDRELPVTANSAAAKVARRSIMDYLGCDTVADYNRRYRGMCKVRQGGVAYTASGMVPFARLAPISTDAAMVMNMGSIAYHGGNNASMLIGYHDKLTYDVDVQNAYPTGMRLVPDVDWERPVLSEFRDRDLERDDFDGALGPCTPLLAEVSFEFPSGVYMPCLPIAADTALIHPRTSDGAGCVVAAAPELWIALRLGARVHVKHGVRLRPLRRDDGSYSMCLSNVVGTFVESRAEAKRKYGKGSLAELLAKLCINGGGYGKVSQGVAQKSTYNAFKGVMEDLEGSAVTSPYHAAMITSLVRALLAAAMNQLHELGYEVYSVTTDGFITDATVDELEALDLFGLAPYFHRARLALTDGQDPSIWALKHAQDDLLNFSTRGNVSLHVGGEDSVLDGLPGVCAHNSLVTGEVKDSRADREALFRAVAARTGKVETHKPRPTDFRRLTDRDDRADFIFRDQGRFLSMDFDCKRRPLRDTMRDVDVPVDGQTCPVARFDTEPWDSVDDYLKAKAIARRIAEGSCLRTRADWERFFLRFNATGRFSAKDPAWALVKAAVQLYRMGRAEIPPLAALNDGSDGSIDRCVAWVNRFVPRSSKHAGKFTRDTWKGLGRRNRNVTGVPVEMLDDVLGAMRADDPAPWLALWA